MMGQNRFLAVDQGNSLLKLTLFEGGQLREVCRFSADALEDVFSVVDRWMPDSGAFCSVGKIDPRMVESLRLALDGRLLILSRSTLLPIRIDYGTPGTLGLDRVALAVGASMLYKGETIAVADAGTAVTLDVVDSGPCFRGGRITPGIRLRFEALHSHTAALPKLKAGGVPPLIGDTTASSLQSGVVGGLADEIVETYRQYNQHYGCTRLLLTGGDAPLLAECINSRIPADHEPDLMARGLLFIYNYNEI